MMTDRKNIEIKAKDVSDFKRIIGTLNIENRNIYQSIGEKIDKLLWSFLNHNQKKTAK